MRNARVIHFRPERKRKKRFLLRKAPLLLLNLIRVGIVIVPLVLASSYMLQHGTPHFLWEYTYYEVGGQKQMTSCTYLGIHGVKSGRSMACPWIEFFQEE